MRNSETSDWRFRRLHRKLDRTPVEFRPPFDKPNAQTTCNHSNHSQSGTGVYRPPRGARHTRLRLRPPHMFSSSHRVPEAEVARGTGHPSGTSICSQTYEILSSKYSTTCSGGR